ncbi:MAG TPA: hypothetical protein VLJ68_12665, partial [Chitinophagaceae bacterium]|nr:hypothetical protein [Chitinophagaceae bacterium]
LPDWLTRSGENIFDRTVSPVLVKMNIANVEYAEPTYSSSSRTDHLFKNIYKWLLRTTLLHKPARTIMGNLHQSHS